MKNTDKQRLALAHHRAGHAAAHYLLDLPYGQDQIVADLDNCLLRREESVELDLRPKDNAKLIALESQVIVELAGVVAEAEHRGELRWKHGSDDFNSAFAHAVERHHECSMNEILAFLNYSWVRTYELVKHARHGKAIDALAAALMERQTLSQREVADVIEGLASKEPQRWRCSSWENHPAVIEGERLSLRGRLRRLQ